MKPMPSQRVLVANERSAVGNQDRAKHKLYSYSVNKVNGNTGTEQRVSNDVDREQGQYNPKKVARPK